MNFESLLAAGPSSPWYHGFRITDTGPAWESIELLMVFVLFVGVLITVYYIQRWIGDY